MQHVLDPITGRRPIGDGPSNSADEPVAPKTEVVYVHRRSPSPIPRTVYVEDPALIQPEILERPTPRTFYIQEPVVLPPQPLKGSSLASDEPPSYRSESPSWSSSDKPRSPIIRNNNNMYNEKLRDWKQQPATSLERTQYNPYTSVMARRRCLMAILVLLVLLVLAGVIVGLYFGITAAQTAAAKNSPKNKVPAGYTGGYYINGVYVVPLTSKPFATYLIYGVDTPCSNITVKNPNYPNCKLTTTSIAWVNWSTTTPRTIYLSSASRGLVMADIFVVIAMALISIPIATHNQVMSFWK